MFKKIFKNGSYRRYNYHLVKQELLKLARAHGIVLGSETEETTLYYEIKDWIDRFYTYYETEEEFNIAKTLLFSYIDGKQMKEVFKPSFIDGVRAYCLQKFFPHFAHVAFFMYKDKLNFERKTSCCVEGIVHGIQNKKSGITSNMSVDNSVMKINEQAEH